MKKVEKRQFTPPDKTVKQIPDEESIGHFTSFYLTIKHANMLAFACVIQLFLTVDVQLNNRILFHHRPFGLFGFIIREFGLILKKRRITLQGDVAIKSPPDDIVKKFFLWLVMLVLRVDDFQ